MCNIITLIFNIFSPQFLILMKKNNNNNAKNIVKERIKRHKSDLKGDRHDNKYLQNDWNLFGEDCFEFKVVKNYDEIIQSLNLMNLSRVSNPPKTGFN